MAAAALMMLAALLLSACKEVETESAAGYEPAKLEAIKGAKEDDAKRITFTKEGAARTDLKTGKVRRVGEQTVMPYTALLYNDEAKPFVYTSPKPLSYLRAPVTVDRIEGQRVYLSDGPPAGTTVVTVGATEVYGTELEIAEK
jgi:multidrug efflux pump subunit AcrA (membrane-fusion protein)